MKAWLNPKNTLFVTLGVTLLLVLGGAAYYHLYQGAHPHHSPYAGEEKRRIKSLSAEDIAELQRGGGWGLAKAAELNGVPGPAHLLEMQQELGISPKQHKAIQGIYQQMQAQAITQGRQLLVLEAALEKRFQERRLTEATLGAAVEQISQLRGQLRYTHLVAHLKTVKVLRPAQVRKYNALRGYVNN